MRRIDHFRRPWGNNWLTGRSLIPLLVECGKSQRGIVIDYGCGESPFRFCFSNAEQYIRLDIKPRDNGTVPVDGKNLPIRGSSVDCVLLFQVLGDIPDFVPFLEEVHRVLKPKGLCVVYEAVSYPEHDLPHDYFRIMPNGLEWIALRTKFTVSGITRFGGFFARVAQLVNGYLLGRFRGLFALGVLGGISVATFNFASLFLDSLIRRPNLTVDYLAILERRAVSDEKLGRK